MAAIAPSNGRRSPSTRERQPTIINDEKMRALYTEREAYRDEIDDAFGEGVGDGSARVDFVSVERQLTELRAIVESAIDYDEEEVEQYVSEVTN